MDMEGALNTCTSSDRKKSRAILNGTDELLDQIEELKKDA